MTERTSTDANQYKLSLRFGDEVLEAGFTAVPNILLQHYFDLGMGDGQCMLITHLLTHQWTAGAPFPRLRNLHMTANTDTRRRYVRGLRDAGLLFTRRLYKDGQVDTQEYHLGSLWWNLRRLVGFKQAWKRPRAKARAINHGFRIELPEFVMARIVRRFYHDTPTRWQEVAAEHARQIIAAQKQGKPIPKSQQWAIFGSTEEDEEASQVEELEELVTLSTVPVRI
jgi:hypothetical protein